MLLDQFNPLIKRCVLGIDGLFRCNWRIIMEIQNLLIFFTLITTIIVAFVTSRQNTRILNVDINFRALDRRKKLFQQLQSELKFFSRELSCDGSYYPDQTESEEYEDAIDLYEKRLIGGYPLDYGDLLYQKEKIDLLLVEATLIFPSAKNEFCAIRNYILTIIDLLNATSLSEAEENGNTPKNKGIKK